MILLWLIGILIGGGLLAWIAGRYSPAAARWISLGALLLDFLLVAGFGIVQYETLPLKPDTWILELSYSWIPSFGISFHLALDGLSLLLISLTMFLGIIAVLVSWTEIHRRVGFYYFNLLWVLAGITGVFLAVDLFLFYFFWELMLIPMYFLIGIWGHERRLYAAYKFFLFTQASGLLLFLAILGLYYIHGQNTGQYTFAYAELLGTEMSSSTSTWLLLGFLAAFLVKLAAAPLHTWLPDAHAEAPTAGSLILAGLLLKTGAYGLLRFAVPLFPEASTQLAPVMMILGAFSVLYGAILAFAQSDLKRLVAYTSVSHMGFVLLGVFAFNALAYHGVVIQLLAHGLSTGALFIIAGILQNRLATRELSEMGGFWREAPGMGALALVFVMAALGLPGLGNFVAEFLILIGAWQAAPVWAGIAALGLLASAIYALRIMQRVFHGPLQLERPLADLKIREWLMLLPMALLLLWLGLFPQIFIRQADLPLQKILIRQDAKEQGSTSLRNEEIKEEEGIFLPEPKTTHSR